MKLVIPKNSLSMSPVLFLRKAGYAAITNRDGEDSFIRRLGLDYPRFHVYYEETANEVIFNLHLDQKKPSYEGSHAHSGEYDGDLVEREIARLKSMT